MAYWVSLVLVICLAALPSHAVAKEAKGSRPPQKSQTAGRFADSAVSPEALEESIRSGLGKVEEITFLRQEMAKLGLKHGWLFGGTAAAFGHYANWDLRRRQGDQRFQPNRFDYDYTNIFRSTQDLDIVIDGTPEQAEALERRLREAYPHLQGTQSAWEVRLLREDRGSKEALLGNPNFLNQHTDSNSTGLIEFTEPANGTSLVRDLRDEGPRYPKFFEDIRLGKLKFYFSPSHETTSRFQKGLNPPIFSVIRYFTKLFQYELEVDPEDEKNIRKIIKEFDPSTLTEREALNWIRKNGKKLFQNAVNLEYAAQTLKDFKLKNKLVSFDSADEVNSLAWWLSRKPLASKTVGLGSGATAASLGLDVVAHETNDYLAYESITRSHTGEPNVFTSREGAVGEAAAYGEGFYTKVGREGARNTGITIRFKLNPSAREGTDFTYDRSSQFVIVHNRRALEVIPESLDLTPRQFFDLLIHNGATWGANDKSILEKFRRRMKNKLMAKPEEISGIAKSVNAALMNEAPNLSLLKEWISFADQIKGHNDLMEQILRPLTQSKNTWVSLLANIKLSERGLPANLEVKKPLLTYFQAVQSFNPSPYEPDDPHFKKLFKDIDLKSANPDEIKEIFRILKDDLKIAGSNGVPEHLMNHLMGKWGKLWESGYKTYPLALKSIAREIAEDPAYRQTPRYMAMDALDETLKTQKDPELIDFFLKKLSDEARPVAYRAIFGLAKHAPDDPRVQKAIAEYFVHPDDLTMQHALKAFEKIKTKDTRIHHKLLRLLNGRHTHSLSAVPALRNNVPTDKKSVAMLDDMIKQNNYISEYAIEIRSLMPDSGRGSVNLVLDVLKGEEKLFRSTVLAAVKALAKLPETKQYALDTAFKNFSEMGAQEKYAIIDFAKFFLEQDQHLPEALQRLDEVVKNDSSMAYTIKPLAEKISERIRLVPGLNCPGAFAQLL